MFTETTWWGCVPQTKSCGSAPAQSSAAWRAWIQRQPVAPFRKPGRTSSWRLLCCGRAWTDQRRPNCSGGTEAISAGSANNLPERPAPAWLNPTGHHPDLARSHAGQNSSHSLPENFYWGQQTEDQERFQVKVVKEAPDPRAGPPSAPVPPAARWCSVPRLSVNRVPAAL